MSVRSSVSSWAFQRFLFLFVAIVLSGTTGSRAQSQSTNIEVSSAIQQSSVSPYRGDAEWSGVGGCISASVEVAGFEPCGIPRGASRCAEGASSGNDPDGVSGSWPAAGRQVFCLRRGREREVGFRQWVRFRGISAALRRGRFGSMASDSVRDDAGGDARTGGVSGRYGFRCVECGAHRERSV